MAEDSVTVMLLPEDDTETILEKVRRAGAKKVNLIVPPGNRALQTLGGFTMLRKACDITGIDLTVYSDDEKARDMAQVCRFEVVRLDQEARPREVKPPAVEPPVIVVSTRPPEPTREVAVAAAVGEAEERPAELRERLGGLSEADQALFDSLEAMSLERDVELRPEVFGRPVGAVEAPAKPAVPRKERALFARRREERPPKERPLKEKGPPKPSALRPILETAAGALANVYIAVAGLFLKVTARFQPQRAAAVPAAVAVAEAPAAVGPRVLTDEEARQLRLRKLRYSLWALAGVVAFTVIVVGLYLLSLPVVTVSLTPKEAETKQLDLALTVALTNTVNPKSGVSVQGGAVSVPAQAVQVELQGQVSGPATGQILIAEGTAVGAVVFTNMTQYAMTVPAGTRLSGAGASFHTTQDVFLAASDFWGSDAYVGKAQVNVVADSPGSAGNLPVGVITGVEGDLAGVVNVINEVPTTGGSERQATVVSPEDQERLRGQLVADLQRKAYDELQSKISASSLEVLSGTLKVETLEETFSQSVGGEAQALTLTARVRASALASVLGALDKAVAQAVQQKVQSKAGQEFGKVTYQALQQGQPGAGVNANNWTYKTTATVPILNSIDDSLKAEIRGKLRGKTYQQARLILEGYRDRITSFAISPVLGRLPSWGRIQVVDITQIK